MSETNYTDDQPPSHNKSLFSLKHRLISRTARHMQNLYLKFQKRAKAVSRSYHIPRVSEGRLSLGCTEKEESGERSYFGRSRRRLEYKCG